MSPAGTGLGSWKPSRPWSGMLPMQLACMTTMGVERTRPFVRRMR